MTLYLYQCTDSLEAFDRQLEQPHDRLVAAAPAIEAMGATVVAGGYPFGEDTFAFIFEAPDDVTAAALVLAVNATREVSSVKWSRLLSGQEWIQALQKARVSPFMQLRPGGYPAGAVPTPVGAPT